VRRLSAALLVLAAHPLASQQIPLSQRGVVTQMVGGTEIEIRYSRPVARGRELFGKLVPWGKVWCPGADTATTVSFTRPVRVSGKPLEAGTYSLWAIPEPDTWTVIFSRAQPVFHIPYPEGRDALRIRVPVRQGPHMETLAFYFPVVDGKDATLSLHWGTTIVSLDIRVD
jgi:hypothetical protein